jgi:plastocyanin domain-containing protein
MRIRFVFPLVSALLFTSLTAGSAIAKDKTAKAAETKAEIKADKAEKPAEAKPAQVVEITVTKEGFVPKEIKVKAGQPVKLQVTRKIEKTCAKDIVIKDYGINQPLPLDQTVTVTFTPSKAGSSRFACGMDMIAGVIVAE